MRVFPDTNVLLSAFFGVGFCAALLERLLESDHEILIGEPVAREFVRISRDRFKVPSSSLSYALEVLRRQTPVPAAHHLPNGIPDPDDVPILACALAGGADFFVTGDQALLELRSLEGMPIVSPRQCWEQLQLHARRPE